MHNSKYFKSLIEVETATLVPRRAYVATRGSTYLRPPECEITRGTTHPPGCGEVSPTIGRTHCAEGRVRPSKVPVCRVPAHERCGDVIPWTGYPVTGYCRRRATTGPRDRKGSPGLCRTTGPAPIGSTRATQTVYP